MAQYRQYYYIEVYHPDLNKYQMIKGYDKHEVELKAALLKERWNEEWNKKKAKEDAYREKEEREESAIEQTEEAEEAVENMNNVLIDALKKEYLKIWSKLFTRPDFKKLKPSPPLLLIYPTEPNENDRRFKPIFGLLDMIFSSRKQKKIMEYKSKFEDAYSEWRGYVNEYKKKNELLTAEYEKKVLEWEKEKEEFEKEIAAKNNSILKKKEKYLSGDRELVCFYIEYLLNICSEYPFDFCKNIDVDYNPENKLVLIDYSLPRIEEIPNLKEVRYIKTKNEIRNIYFTEKELNSMYNNVIYRITLRTILEVFKSDIANAIDMVVFNGWLTAINKGTGNETTNCILSIQVNKETFMKLNLSQVDPKECFRSLKGIGSINLAGMTPIAPIMEINKEDKRFVQAREVGDKLYEGYNLATMDWEDFEHLIRELFEKYFAATGGEVKITRASRDQGVDAVAFDPDPIKGGKIVIQAKRYNNVVGVSAVRDLYGTLLNEGAIKGILVTTSDYGPDSFEFAKGKPISLLNGSNLLYLLEQHGYKAHINLNELKK